MTCLESMHLPAPKLRNSFLSNLVPIILKSDKNCGCAGIFRDAGPICMFYEKMQQTHAMD